MQRLVSRFVLISGIGVLLFGVSIAQVPDINPSLKVGTLIVGSIMGIIGALRKKYLVELDKNRNDQSITIINALKKK